jgi:hypothetical protein
VPKLRIAIEEMPGLQAAPGFWRPTGRYLARVPLGSKRHIYKERNRGQRAPSRLSADRLGRPIDLTQRLSLRKKRESR